jgi:hypothetical protein
LSFLDLAKPPAFIDPTKPSNVWGLDGTDLRLHYIRQGYRVGPIQPPKEGTSGNAQVFALYDHPTIAEVQYHTGQGQHRAAYYKFTIKDAKSQTTGVIKIIDPKSNYFPKGETDVLGYFSPEGVPLELLPNGRFIPKRPPGNPFVE